MNIGIEIYLLVFVLGLILGSFYNVVALRTLKGESLSFPPSHCTICNHKLSPLDLIPVVSWTFARGKCVYCGDKISYIYPIGELLTAFSYVVVLYTFGFSMETVIQIVFITAMIWSTIADMKDKIVPDRFILIGVIAVLLLRVISGEDLVYYILSGIGSFLVMLLVFILSNGRMGGADVKIYALVGLAIGAMDSLGSLFYAAFISLAFQIPIIAKNNWKVDRQKEIPFVPFITLGVLCTYLLDLFNFLN